MSRRLRRSQPASLAYCRPGTPETGVASETPWCRARRTAAPPRRFRGADTLDQGLGLRRPFVLHPQLRQGRLRQRVEGAPTGFAVIAGQPARRAPAHHVAVGAMGTAKTVRAIAFDFLRPS